MVGPYHAHHRALPAAMSDRALSEDPNSHLAHKLPYRAHKHSDMAGPFDEHWRDLSNMQCNGRYLKSGVGIFILLIHLWWFLLHPGVVITAQLWSL